MTEPAPQPPVASSSKTLRLSQTGFLAATALGVLLMFVFVILPYVDKKPAMSGKPVPDFNLELLSGGARGDRIRLSDLQGKKVILDFWASWCLPCREQAAVLRQMAPTLGPDVVVLGIATNDSRSDAENFLRGHATPYSNAIDEDGALGRSLEIHELPTLLVLDKRGTLRGSASRTLDAAELRGLLESAE